MPAQTSGDAIQWSQTQRKDLKTKPSARFTESSPIKAIESIASFVMDPAHKKILKEGNGIGTSSTRASIVARLRNRKLLESKGKQIVSSELDSSLISVVPASVKSVSITTLFEKL